jgi:hypothetical protein
MDEVNPNGNPLDGRSLEPLFSIGEVAELWGMSTWWVRERLKAGELGPLVDFNGDLRLTESGLRAFQVSKMRTPWVVPEERRRAGLRLQGRTRRRIERLRGERFGEVTGAAV